MSVVLNFPEAVPQLSGDLVHLRELTEDDIPPWFARATDAESADLAGDPIPNSIAMGLPWLARHRERFQQRLAIRWAIVLNGATVSVGTAGLVITSEQQRTAELGIVIARAYWSKGIGTAATRLVNNYAFATLGLMQIQAEVLQRNLASRRLLEKTGFHLLRALPGDPQSGGDTEDCLLYGLSKSRP
jgi:[ribosomal protein S5]-alanine N-acetyltransferase